VFLKECAQAARRLVQACEFAFQGEIDEHWMAAALLPGGDDDLRVAVLPLFD